MTYSVKRTCCNFLAGLWTDFLNRYPYTETAAEPPHPSESFIRLLNQAFDAGAHQVSELADALHISERTLQRRLKESFGTTASEWLRHKHMQYALYALGTDSVSIGENSLPLRLRPCFKLYQGISRIFRLHTGGVEKTRRVIG